MLLYNTDGDDALRVAEELRQAVANAPLLSDHSVTTSIGVAILQGDEDRRAWMKHSDENLYLAKSRGRNQVVA